MRARASRRASPSEVSLCSAIPAFSVSRTAQRAITHASSSRALHPGVTRASSMPSSPLAGSCRDRRVWFIIRIGDDGEGEPPSSTRGSVADTGVGLKRGGRGTGRERS
jgi:hypothetical protein